MRRCTIHDLYRAALAVPPPPLAAPGAVGSDDPPVGLPEPPEPRRTHAAATAAAAGQRTRRFTVAQLRAMPRPPEYLQELRDCAVRASLLARNTATAGWLEFDLDAPCYRALKAKYAAAGAAPAAARSTDPGDRGLGDTIHRVTHATGLHHLARVWTRLTGKPCGCAGRRRAMNRWLPYHTLRGPRP